jgi:hypothetical protein
VLFRLRGIARSAIQLAEAEVAVGHEGAHPAFLGQRQRLALMLVHTLDFRRTSMTRDLAEEPPSMRQPPPLVR